VKMPRNAFCREAGATSPQRPIFPGQRQSRCWIGEKVNTAACLASFSHKFCLRLLFRDFALDALKIRVRNLLLNFTLGCINGGSCTLPGQLQKPICPGAQVAPATGAENDHQWY
jgi:hypothetical protein